MTKHVMTKIRSNVTFLPGLFSLRTTQALKTWSFRFWLYLVSFYDGLLLALKFAGSTTFMKRATTTCAFGLFYFRDNCRTIDNLLMNGTRWLEDDDFGLWVERKRITVLVRLFFWAFLLVCTWLLFQVWLVYGLTAFHQSFGLLSVMPLRQSLVRVLAVFLACQQLAVVICNNLGKTLVAVQLTRKTIDYGPNPQISFFKRLTHWYELLLSMALATWFVKQSLPSVWSLLHEINAQNHLGLLGWLIHGKSLHCSMLLLSFITTYQVLARTKSLLIETYNYASAHSIKGGFHLCSQPRSVKLSLSRVVDVLLNFFVISSICFRTYAVSLSRVKFGGFAFYFKTFYNFMDKGSSNITSLWNLSFCLSEPTVPLPSISLVKMRFSQVRQQWWFSLKKTGTMPHSLRDFKTNVRARTENQHLMRRGCA